VCETRTKIKILDRALFEAQPGDEIYQAWQRRLELCTTDRDLMEITLLAQYNNGLNWIRTYIERRVCSAVPLDKARALTLLGFLDVDDRSWLQNQLRDDDVGSWVKDLSMKSLNRRETDSWAKHWYKRFLEDDDLVLSWAAFRLFRLCVDSRFWFWHETIQQELEVCEDKLSKRLRFLATNLSDLENRIRKNEKPLREQLFGQKIRHGQTWPWM
jgi:hypothetical protein